MSVLNLKKQGKDTLFLGESLGLQNYVTVKYPQLEQLALKQRSQFWTEVETSHIKDVAQWPTLPDNIKHLVIKNIAFQSLADSLAGRVPFTVLLNLVTNEELEWMYGQLGYFEQLHSRAYSHIIKTVMPDAEAVMEEIRTDIKASTRLDYISREFDKLHELGLEYLYCRDVLKDKPWNHNIDELKEAIFTCILSLYAMESIQFYASFACNFALSNNNILSGISNQLTLIIKDEALHTHMELAILNILKEEWPDVANKVLKEKAHLILEEVANNELTWGPYVLGDTEIVGLTADLLQQYTKYIARLSFSALGIEVPDYLNVQKNPLPWITKYTDGDSMQVAPQEITITNYRIGSVTNDLTDDFINNLEI